MMDTNKRLTMRLVFIIDFKIRFNEYPILFMWLPGFGEPALFSLYSAFGAMWFWVFFLCSLYAFILFLFVVNLSIHSTTIFVVACH